MSRILYGLCGEGLGHSIRSKILINYLRKKHEIKIVAGGRAYTFLSKEFEDIEEIESARFVFEGNYANLFLTVFRTLYRLVFGTPSSFLKIRKIIKDFQPEILIVDAEPISNFVAWLNGIKRISIDNPHSLIHRDYKLEWGEYIPWFLLKIAIKISMANADKYIIYDYFDEQINNPKVLFLKPLIQEKILEQKPVHGNHVFIYQSLGYDEKFCNMLKDIDEKFILYGVDQNRVDKNIVFKKFNHEDFYHDLATAKAVITNGGFTAISEALYLKKPIFSIPIKNQFEQILNGKFVEKLGVGKYKMDMNKMDINDFFNNLDRYRENLKHYDPENQEETLKRIDEEMEALLSIKKSSW